MNKTQAWIATDKQGILDDIKRLGLDGAVEYNFQLIQNRIELGDDRWHDITRESLEKEFKNLN